MLAQIAAVYVHLGRADADGSFARAIVDDERSYRRDMFPEAAQVRGGTCLCWHACHVSCTQLRTMVWWGSGADAPPQQFCLM